MIDLGQTVLNRSQNPKMNHKQGLILKLKYQLKEKLKKKEEWNHQSHQFSHQ